MRTSVEERAGLDKRLAAIERENRRLKFGLLSMLLLLAPLLLLGAKHGLQDGQFGEITAQKITIVDESGTALVRIGSEKDEGIGMSIHSEAGQRLMTFGISADGQGSGIMVSDAEGRARIGLGMDQGVPGIALLDKDGAKIIAMGGTRDKGYGILVNDGEEKQRIGLGYNGGNAGIMLYDDEGRYVRGLIRQDDGSHYASYIDKEGTEVFEN